MPHLRHKPVRLTPLSTLIHHIIDKTAITTQYDYCMCSVLPLELHELSSAQSKPAFFSFLFPVNKGHLKNVTNILSTLL